MSQAIIQRPLSYVQRLQSRCTDIINLVVIHCTELPDLPMARVFGEEVHHPKTQTGNCGHFYIDRDGSVEQWVPLSRIAHHVRGFNPLSIGIELVNNGRYPDWFFSSNQQMKEPYAEAQIEALLVLLQHLQTSLGGLEFIAGHEDLDTGMVISEDRSDIEIRRKLDPGPLFPWSDIMEQTTLRRYATEDHEN